MCCQLQVQPWLRKVPVQVRCTMHLSDQDQTCAQWQTVFVLKDSRYAPSRSVLVFEPFFSEELTWSNWGSSYLCVLPWVPFPGQVLYSLTEAKTSLLCLLNYQKFKSFKKFFHLKSLMFTLTDNCIPWFTSDVGLHCWGLGDLPSIKL